MLANMTKTDIAIFFLLIGMLLGMATSIFSGYSLDIDRTQKLIATSCLKSKPTKYDVYLFGKIVDVECADGQYHHYQLFKSESE